MNLKSFRLTRLTRSLCGSLSILAVAATVGHPERAAAIDLNFVTTTQTQTDTNPYNFNFGPGVGNSGPVNSVNPTGSTGAVVVNYTNVATGVDARITAQTFGANYSFVEHIPNYSVNTLGQPAGDAAFFYQIAANQLGAGGMTYTIDLFQTDGTTHNFSTAYVAPNLSFSVYDVDGENTATANQTEAVRVLKGSGNSGLAGYQVSTDPTAGLIVTENATSYLFSGRGVNQSETSFLGSALLYFQNTSSVTFQFEANTVAPALTSANPVFSGIDGDLSMIKSQAGTTIDSNGYVVATGVSSFVQAKKLPEPFTIIGSIIGGTAAFGIRKKLKAASK